VEAENGRGDGRKVEGGLVGEGADDAVAVSRTVDCCSVAGPTGDRDSGMTSTVLFLVQKKTSTVLFNFFFQKKIGS